MTGVKLLCDDATGQEGERKIEQLKEKMKRESEEEGGGKKETENNSKGPPSILHFPLCVSI